MKRLYFACPDRSFSVKMYEAPVTWQRFPNAITRVTSNTIKSYAYHDKPRLFSALIRVARRKMTMNEASASHKLTLTLIKKVYSLMFSKMSKVIMNLMDHGNIDIKLLGNEMNEEGFEFEPASEEDLKIAMNDKGEQYAFVDPLATDERGRLDEIAPKKSHYSPSTRLPLERQFSSHAPTLVKPKEKKSEKPKEEKATSMPVFKDVLIKPKEELLDTPNFVTPKEENSLNIFPSTLVQPKEEEIDPFSCQYVLPKEERPGGYTNELLLPKEENQTNSALYGGNLDNGFIYQSEDTALYTSNLSSEQYESGDSASSSHGLDYSHEPILKMEDDLFLGNRDIKTELHHELLNENNDQYMYTGNMNGFGYYGENRDYFAVKEEEEDPMEDIPDEEVNENIAESIEMALHGSKLSGPHRAVMKAALKDSMVHHIPVPDIVQVYKFPNHSMIVNLIHKARVFLKGICRKANESLPANFASPSVHTRDFVPGEPLDPVDSKRLQKIGDVVTALSNRCMYSRSKKEGLQAALLDVCIGKLTLNAASNKYNLPSSTIHPYVVKARQSLGSILPPPASVPIQWNYQMEAYRPATYHDDIDNSPDAFGKQTFTMEQLDRIVSDLVKNSHANQAGKQAIFDGVISVITNGNSASYASRKTGIPLSTIKTYVARTKQSLKMQPPLENIDFVPRRKVPPIVASLAAKLALREDVEKYANQIISVLTDRSRHAPLFRAVVGVVMGEMTTREAADSEKLSPSSVLPYVAKVRHVLGMRCSPAKLFSNVNAKTPRLEIKVGVTPEDTQTLIIAERDLVTIDGISVPRSVRLLSRLLTVGQIDYSKAQAFMGDKDELETKIIKILHGFRYQGDRVNMARGIIHLHVDDKTITDAVATFRLSRGTLVGYARAMKVFIDFAASPCSREYQYAAYKRRSLEVMKGIQEGVEAEEDAMSSPMRLPLPPAKIVPVENPEPVLEEDGSKSTTFLSAADRRSDILWQGQGLDYITRRMKMCFLNQTWKFDTNGDKNEILISTLFQPRASSLTRMERLKLIIQYAVNDRVSARERLYLRPLLIHHLCNGFSLSYLLSVYEHRITHTEDELQEYCEIITSMYLKTGKITLDFLSNLTKCGMILDVNAGEGEKVENEMEQANLRREMNERFPFLARDRMAPVTTEKLSPGELKKRKYECCLSRECSILGNAVHQVPLPEIQRNPHSRRILM